MSDPAGPATPSTSPYRRPSVALPAAGCLVVGAVLGFASLGGPAGVVLIAVTVLAVATVLVRCAA